MIQIHRKLPGVMQIVRHLQIAAIVLPAAFRFPSVSAAQTALGDPPRAPKDVSGLAGGGPKSLSVTGGFSVNTDSREEVRSFYNAVYASSDGVPMNTTADVSSCTPGTNSTAFREAVLRRINWFRAMAGVPASVTFDAVESASDQEAAVIMSANTNLSHFPTPGWNCYTGSGAIAASNSNLTLGNEGVDAITSYIWDFGPDNSFVGHRRWILYPQTQVMGTGDVPETSTYQPANTTWVFDANLFGPRPATRQPYVSWPPKGYVPCSVVYQRWSFALSNADFSVATVAMKSNGLPVSAVVQPYTTGYGENTLVWVPMGLDATGTAAFPFNGIDTVYSITVTNIKVGIATVGFSYNVVVFDPAVPGADSFPPVISGPNQPAVGGINNYTFTPVPHPHLTGYQWRSSQRSPGDLTDGAEGGLVNFTAATTAGYSVVTTGVAASGSYSFHLAQPVAEDQVLQLNEALLPATNGRVTFKSLLGYATSNQVARVQVSTTGGSTWRDLYRQPGTDGPGESSFASHSLSLSNYGNVATLLRFNYHLARNSDGSYSIYTGTDTSPPVGWFLDDIVVTNAEQLIGLTTHSIASTNFAFTPALATNYDLEACAVIFGQFPDGWGPVKKVTAVVAPPVILLGRPRVAGNLVLLDFALQSGTPAAFELLQVDRLGALWSTNMAATLTTNVPGSSYRFATSAGPSARFYRVQSP